MVGVSEAVAEGLVVAGSTGASVGAVVWTGASVLEGADDDNLEGAGDDGASDGRVVVGVCVVGD